jgi:hypothetical protein
MKLKIEIGFTDKYTGQKYNAGEEVVFEDERAKELLADERKLVSEVIEEEEAPKPKRPAKKKTTKK